MKIVKGNYGECRFCDNMDEESGLPSLEDKSWDLCLTDPPYNLKFNGARHGTKEIQKKRNSEKIWYFDNLPSQDYYDWCWIWSLECFNKSNLTLITPGYVNFNQWILQYPEVHFGIWTDLRANGGSSIASFRKFEPFLCFNFNIRKQHNRLKFAWLNIDEFFKTNTYGDFVHPCPKNEQLWSRFIKELKLESIIDPFLGSGTTAEVCESLGIPWLGYELMEDYAPDIEKRIARGITKKKYATKQQTLF